MRNNFRSPIFNPSKDPHSPENYHRYFHRALERRLPGLDLCNPPGKTPKTANLSGRGTRRRSPKNIMTYCPGSRIIFELVLLATRFPLNNVFPISASAATSTHQTKIPLVTLPVTSLPSGIRALFQSEHKRFTQRGVATLY